MPSRGCREITEAVAVVLLRQRVEAPAGNVEHHDDDHDGQHQSPHTIHGRAEKQPRQQRSAAPQEDSADDDSRSSALLNIQLVGTGPIDDLLARCRPGSHGRDWRHRTRLGLDEADARVPGEGRRREHLVMRRWAQLRRDAREARSRMVVEEPISPIRDHFFEADQLAGNDWVSHGERVLPFPETRPSQPARPTRMSASSYWP